MAKSSSGAADGAEVIAQSLARVLGDEAAYSAVREAAHHLGLSGTDSRRAAIGFGVIFGG